LGNVCGIWRQVLARLILVNRYFHPDDSATSQIATALSSALVERGWSVDVVTSRQLYADPSADLQPAERFRRVNIHRLWTTRMGRRSLAGRFIAYLAFYASTFTWLLKHARRGDIIVVLTDPPLISVPTALAARLRGCNQVNWLHDLFPEVAHALGILPSDICLRALTSVRNWSLRCSTVNVVIGRRMGQHLVRQGVPEERITIIHNWPPGPDIASIAPEDNGLRVAWGLSERFVIGYSGNLGRVHEYATILQAADMLRDEQDTQFLFIGGGHLLAALALEANRRGLTNIIVKPYQPRSRLSESLSVPDVHLISLLPRVEGLCVPSKFYGIAAAGRPTIFIGDQRGEIPQLLRAANCGIAVAAGDAVRLVRYIKRLKRNAALRTLWGENARTLVDLRFDQRLAIAHWMDLLDKIISAPNHLLADQARMEAGRQQ
jgi:colanic acid biosynthesis glycosyl transferase WcaI